MVLNWPFWLSKYFHLNGISSILKTFLQPSFLLGKSFKKAWYVFFLFPLLSWAGQCLFSRQLWFKDCYDIKKLNISKTNISSHNVHIMIFNWVILFFMPAGFHPHELIRQTRCFPSRLNVTTPSQHLKNVWFRDFVRFWV